MSPRIATAKLVLLLSFSTLAQEPLTNGLVHPGDLPSAGASESWTFDASAGDGLMIRVGATNFTPRIRLFDGASTLIAETTSGNSITRDGWLALQATNAGNYTVTVSATFPGQTGSYGLHLARAPGAFSVSQNDQGGELVNGTANPATLALGDLDLWSFSATGGEAFMLRVGASTFTPWLRLYGPNGALISETTSGNTITRDGVLALSATNGGSYTLVVSASYSGQSGEYSLHYVKASGGLTISLGDEGGALTNGIATAANLSVGDLDAWAFPANANDGLMLRVGAEGFTPWLRLYGPEGVLISETTSGNTITRDGNLALQATNAGTYTLVVSATYPGQSGAYDLHLAQSPAEFFTLASDQGGSLTNGAVHPGELTLGDLDMWRFHAEGGESIVFRTGGTNFTPWIRLYGPSGTVITETTSGNTIARDGNLSAIATNAGLYTFVISATYAGQSGGYSASFAKVPGEFLLSEGDQGGDLKNGVTNSAVLNLGDFDIWTFYGTPGDSNVLRVVATNFTPWIRLYGPDGALLEETTSGNSITRAGSVSWEVSTAGTYTVVIAATFSGQSGTYSFKQSRWAPDLIVPDTSLIDEGSTLSVSISAQDPDEPNKALEFDLLSAPLGVNLAATGATNATITWVTTEALGPSTNIIVARVTDLVNGRAFRRTNEFTVIINEINTTPQLEVLQNQEVLELTPLNVSASATDADFPANDLAFSLVLPPAGMTINPATGAISWTPGEEQGPSTNTVTVVVTDLNPWAINAQQLSTTNSFSIVVREVNLPPLITVPTAQTIDELSEASFQATATDPDGPPNALTFTLLAPPAGMTINPASGAISWTPSEEHGPSTNVIAVVVMDNSPFAGNVQQLAATNSFTIVVREVNSEPQVVSPGTQSLDELSVLNVTVTASDSDNPANSLSFSLVAPPAGMSINANSGEITWAPTEAQGPSTNVVTVVATDNGSPAMSGTNTFTVVVGELNSPPSIASVSDRSTLNGRLFTYQITASDTDEPANTLTFSLTAAPQEMTIDSATGLISWTPSQAQVGNHSVTIHVTDDGIPAMVATASFQITVTSSELQLSIQPLPGALMQLNITGDVSLNYDLEISTNLVEWARLRQILLDASPYPYVDTTASSAPVRFYRVKRAD